ncbi:MAG: hypothetical protein EOP55_11840 [Sphingobacteriales bacterium]|nr:MAG: hypothetical protein EOP55_11840 [Sphingobacteriales bacterium]
MKKILFALVVCLGLGCSDNSKKKVDDVINETSDSLAAKVDRVGDTLSRVKDDIKSKIPKVEIDVVRTIPISLQWISFEEQGTAKLIKKDNGTYTIKGEQTNSSNEFLKIDGKIKRLDANKLSFEGTIITYIKDNNGGKPCEKTGLQIFAKKGDRNYYRLQNMKNCEGGNLVDYVDLYDVDKVID